jgi:uncharacterized membrane protein (UPF0127 family)
LRAVNVTRDTMVAERLDWAGTSGERRRGLLGRDQFPVGAGLYLAPCQWVHMFGMRFAIDVAFLARDGRVLAVHHGLKPGAISKLVWRADGALELPAGTLTRTGTGVGDVIAFQEETPA